MKKIIFLVDDINNSKSFGITKDIQKIKYNLNLINKSFVEDFEIAMLFMDNGFMDVVDLGRYIAVIGLNKSKTEGEIRFFDSTIDFSRDELIQQIQLIYDEIIAKKFINIYDLMILESSSDCVELFLPT
jgi:hypothetical protein